MKKVLQILEGIYEPQGINVPKPIRSNLVPTPSLRYPATMHGSFLTGLREATKMADHSSIRKLHLKAEKRKTEIRCCKVKSSHCQVKNSRDG